MRRLAAVLPLVVLCLTDRPLTAGQGGVDGVGLEGRPAPRLGSGVMLGPRLPASSDTRQAQLLFFWAHWCVECKAESPIVARLWQKYRDRGLMLIAPTRLYGYAQAGRPAAPDRELRHIAQVRDAFYPFLTRAPVPVAGANYQAYAVDAVPTYVLIDRNGIIRLAKAGRMTESELDEAIARVLAR